MPEVRSESCAMLRGGGRSRVRGEAIRRCSEPRAHRRASDRIPERPGTRGSRRGTTWRCTRAPRRYGRFLQRGSLRGSCSRQVLVDCSQAAAGRRSAVRPGEPHPPGEAPAHARPLEGRTSTTSGRGLTFVSTSTPARTTSSPAWKGVGHGRVVRYAAPAFVALSALYGYQRRRTIADHSTFVAPMVLTGHRLWSYGGPESDRLRNPRGRAPGSRHPRHPDGARSSSRGAAGA